MSSVNKVILIGNVGRDPEIRATQDGKEIANLSLAASESWKDKSGERKERTEWLNVVIFTESLVSVVKQYVKKGDKLYIEGQIKTRKWQDKNGNDRYSTEIVLQGFNGRLVMLSSAKDAPADNGGKEQDAPTQQTQSPLDDEIPFAMLLPLIGAGMMFLQGMGAA